MLARVCAFFFVAVPKSHPVLFIHRSAYYGQSYGQNKKRLRGKNLRSVDFIVVPKAGVEPARLSASDFESGASANSATSACCFGT